MMRKQQKSAILILIAGAFIVICIYLGRTKLAFNITKSVPQGLWLKIDEKPTYGDYVVVPFEAFNIPDWLPDAYERKNKWGQSRSFMKKVSGLPGDLIESGEYGLIKISGKLILNSAPFSHDRVGNELKAFPLPVVLESDEIWLQSDSIRGFDSRYLGPAKLSSCKKAIPLIVF